MSTSRGSTSRQRPQKYQNKTSFKNDLHDTSQKTKLINSLHINGVCKRCKDIIEWKIKYKKYKPLSAPRKCVNCEQKAIKHAYHMLCTKCTSEKQMCAKCFQPIDSRDEEKDELQNASIQTMLKSLSERKRRTILRYINKQQSGDIQKISMARLETMISVLDKMSLDDHLEEDFLSDDLTSSDIEEND